MPSMIMVKANYKEGNDNNLDRRFCGMEPETNKHILQECPEVGNAITLSPRQGGRHFADDIFKCIFLNENVWNAIEISLKFVLRAQLTIFQHWFR